MKKVFAVFTSLIVAMLCCACDCETGDLQTEQRTLATCSAQIVNDLALLGNDESYINAMGTPEEILNMLSCAAAYESEPIIMMTIPENAEAIYSYFEIFNNTAITGIDLYLNTKVFNAFVGRFVGVEALALAGAISIEYYFHCETNKVPTFAIYMPENNAQGNPIALTYDCQNNIVRIRACFLPHDDTIFDLLNPDSEFVQYMQFIGAQFNSTDPFSDLNPKITAPTSTLKVDGEWIRQTAMEAAIAFISNATNRAYIESLTDSPEILAICNQFDGEFLRNTNDITYYSDFEVLPASVNYPIFQKYYSPKYSQILMQSELISCGTATFTFSSICMTSFIIPAQSDFPSCSLIIDCEGEYDIGVAFGFYDEGIAVVNAIAIPNR